MPGFVVVWATGSPRRHTGEPNAVLDDVIQLAVGKILSLRQAHVRHSRVEVLAHLSFSAAIVRMATRAMIGEVAPRFHHGFGGGVHRIFRRARRLGNCEPLYRSTEEGFEGAGRCPRAHPGEGEPAEEERENGRKDREWSDDAQGSMSPIERRSPNRLQSHLYQLRALVVKPVSHFNIDFPRIIEMK